MSRATTAISLWDVPATLKPAAACTHPSSPGATNPLSASVAVAFSGRFRDSHKTRAVGWRVPGSTVLWVSVLVPAPSCPGVAERCSRTALWTQCFVDFHFRSFIFRTFLAEDEEQVSSTWRTSGCHGEGRAGWLGWSRVQGSRLLPWRLSPPLPTVMETSSFRRQAFRRGVSFGVSPRFCFPKGGKLLSS